MKRPTQADVARLAEVSRATVSYVLSGRGDGPITVTEGTRQRVLKAAEQLGYEPDAAAQSLRLRASKTIGVLIPDLTNPHYWQIVRGAEQEAQSRGYDLLLTNTCLDQDRERSGVQALLRRRIDGLVLLLTFGDYLGDMLKMLARRRSPVVLLGVESELYGLDSVNPDYSDGASQLMKHLLALGHRRIGLVCGVARPTLAQDRLDAYRQGLQMAGLPFDENLVIRCGSTMADGHRAAMQLLQCKPRPTAILAINDLLAFGVLRALAKSGLRVPADLSVAGFDDIDASAYTNPPLTTVQGHAEEMGRIALRLILERMSNAERPPQNIRIPAQLIERESTGPAPRTE